MKKKILIATIHMNIGGIEKTLINLLNNIDYNLYEVDLLLIVKNGLLLNKIPKKVNIITPCNKVFAKLISKQNIFSKIIKNILINKYTYKFYKNKKQYDIAIDYSGYYLFINYYIINSNALHKYIYLHENVYGALEYNKKFKKYYINNINKYNYFDKIICVSDSTKNDFNTMFPQFKNKTVVINNVQEDIIIKNKIKLNGSYKLISIGRMVTQKNYERLILVMKKLIDKNLDIKLYIIGNGKYYKKINKLIKKYNLDKYIVLLGEITNIYDYLTQCDLFITTTRYESFPTVLIESLVSNTPWIAPNVKGIKDVYKISPKNSALVVNNDIDSIVNGVIDAYNGKVNKNFKFDVKEYNKKVLNKFYKLIK